jgi:hypothetical protein
MTRSLHPTLARKNGSGCGLPLGFADDCFLSLAEAEEFDLLLCLPGKAGCRGVLAAPVFFAGEACSRSDYSTAHGANLTGVAAADQAIAALRGKRSS